MTGLRARQKADRHNRILGAAVTLFQRDGYRNVRIEDLAQVAGVSVGTVYNYYLTKGDILVATVALEVEEVLAAGEAIIAAPPPGAEAAIMALIGHYYDHSLHYLNKDMWRIAMALSIEAPETPYGRRYTALDARLRAQVVALVARLQARGEVRAGVDATALGETIFNNLNMMFIEFAKDDDMTIEALKDRVARQTAPLARLIMTTGPEGGA